MFGFWSSEVGCCCARALKKIKSLVASLGLECSLFPYLNPQDSLSSYFDRSRFVYLQTVRKQKNSSKKIDWRPKYSRHWVKEQKNWGFTSLEERFCLLASVWVLVSLPLLCSGSCSWECCSTRRVRVARAENDSVRKREITARTATIAGVDGEKGENIDGRRACVHNHPPPIVQQHVQHIRPLAVTPGGSVLCDVDK